MLPLPSFLLMVVSGWVHRHHLIVIEFLQAENRMLKERLHGKRIRFTDAERALLARKAKAVGRKTLLALDTIVSPDTLMRWRFDGVRGSAVCSAIITEWRRETFVRYCGHYGLGGLLSCYHRVAA